MYKFRQILRVDLMNLFTNPIWVAYAIGFPVLLILILGFLLSGTFGCVVTSYDYYGVALMIYSAFNVATFSANSFLEERVKRPNMRIVYSPVRSWYIHFSKVLATFIFCSVTYGVVVLFLHFALHVQFGGVNSWAMIVFMLLLIFLFSALGVLVCCLLKSESSANQLVSLLINIFAAFGGLFFPIEGFGKVISTVSWVSPAKWILTTCLQVIYDADFSAFLPACGILVFLSAVFVLLSVRIFKGEEYL